jgi:diguanylate cyclase (GGDEF)-like protein
LEADEGALELGKRFGALLIGDASIAKYHARLVDSLFAQRSSLIQGSVALSVVQLVCWIRTGSGWFIVAAAASLLVMLARLQMTRMYARRDPASPPKLWASRFMVGSIVAGLTWGITGFAVVWFHLDAKTVQLVVCVQSGWIGGLAVRNAVSPATVLYPSLATLVPPIIAGMASNDLFYQCTWLFFVLQLFANLSIAQYLGEASVAMLLSEQALADSHAQLSQACLELEVANATLQRLSDTDGLTGIGNRRAFDVTLAAEWARCAQEGTPLALLMFDVDRFKAFNDIYGHPSGDACLRLVGGILAGAVRHRRDFAGRFGGEEFVVLLPETDVTLASRIAERLCQEVSDAHMPHQGSPFARVTVSAGVAAVIPEADDSPDLLLARADKALYRAKQSGRNRVEVDGGMPMAEGRRRVRQ